MQSIRNGLIAMIVAASVQRELTDLGTWQALHEDPKGYIEYVSAVYKKKLTSTSRCVTAPPCINASKEHG